MSSLDGGLDAMVSFLPAPNIAPPSPSSGCTMTHDVKDQEKPIWPPPAAAIPGP